MVLSFYVAMYTFVLPDVSVRSEALSVGEGSKYSHSALRL
jgi:hypothetical protein